MDFYDLHEHFYNTPFFSEILREKYGVKVISLDKKEEFHVSEYHKNTFFVVVSGSLAEYSTVTEPATICSAFFWKKRIIGAYFYQKMPIKLIALEKTTLVMLDNEIYIADDIPKNGYAMHAFFEFTEGIMRDRVLFASLLAHPVEKRVLHFFKYTAENNGVYENDGSVTLPKGLNVLDLALYCKCSRQTLSIILNKYQKQGVLQVKRKPWVILDMKELSHIVQE